MAWPSRHGADRRPALGGALVRCLTEDAATLGPWLVGLSADRALALATQAEAHWVGPWWRDRLIAQGLYKALPAAARAVLEAQVHALSARALLRDRELVTLLECLAERGIPVIALKGTYLARAVYPRPGLRPMGDMDLLFRAADLEAVQALLRRLGYAQSGRLVRALADDLSSAIHLVPFARPGATTIEVHFRLERPSAPFTIDHEGLWARARPWPLDGRPLLAPAPEDLLLHLCLHAAYHHRFRISLKALLDIARVVEVEPLDWDACIGRALEWQAAVPTFLCLSLAQRLVGAAVPGPVLAALAPPRSAETALLMLERTLLVERAADGREAPPQLRRAYLHGYGVHLNNMMARPGWRARAAFILAKVFPSREVLDLHYPGFRGSRWVRVMYAVHWLVHLGRLIQGLVANPRYWWTLRRLDRRWFS